MKALFVLSLSVQAEFYFWTSSRTFSVRIPYIWLFKYECNICM